jgi:hypothetical protein
MRFPLAEADILALSRSMVSGLEAHSEAFPRLPVEPEVLDAAIEAFKTLTAKAIEAEAHALAATAAKREALMELTTLMKSDLRYAETAAGRNETLLKYIGWSGPKPKTSQPIPGQPGNLTVVDIGESTLTLTWDAPVDGGRVLAYSVRRRLKTEIAWQDIATAMATTIRLKNQPTGETLEYSVVAMNKSGTSLESNSVAVKL